MKMSNRHILLCIVIIGSVLRLYNIWNMPFTHDELSALFRTNFNSFSELIKYGVETDVHPAGVQVLYYFWTGWFGKEEWIVKLPFIIMGICSIVLIYKIGKLWYNESVALMSAAFIASIQYMVQYSQIGRPYMSGMFFSLMMIYFGSKMLKKPEVRFWLNSVMFGLSASACMYNHHFSLFFALFSGAVGFFLIQQNFRVRYILVWLFILVLYSPHIPIFQTQLEMKGLSGWLGAPSKTYLFSYLFFTVGYSYFALAFLIALVIYGLRIQRSKQFSIQKLLLFSSFLLVPFLIGYIYSLAIDPVLQFSVLIFGFPYIFFALFGHFPQLSEKKNALIVSLILLVNIYTLVLQRRHYEVFWQSPFQTILADHKKAHDSNKSITSVISSHQKILRYYINRFELDSNFIWFNNFKTQADFMNFLSQESTTVDKLFIGTNGGSQPWIIPVAQHFFPCIDTVKNYPVANTYILSKGQKSEGSMHFHQGFETLATPYWSSFNKNNRTNSISFEGTYAYFIDSKTEWGPTFEIDLDTLNLNTNDFIDVSARIFTSEGYENIILAASVESKKGENRHWSALDCKDFAIEDKDSNWLWVNNTLKFADINTNLHSDRLKVFCWNTNHKNFYIDDITISVRRGNPLLYSIIEKF